MSNTAKGSHRKLVGAVGEIAHGESKKFTLQRGRRELEGLLVNFQGNLFAYLNRCPHTGLALDWVNNQFFSADKRYLMCATHGAVFEPPTGECIWGPCVGLSLQALPIEIEEGQVYARLPGATEE
ncbi:MAG TPA: Rieske (2Fe-2S) protein [Methylomirabilota bacterium]|jgi:nitrite reductase/ring-hydroxylating ferredoxin subunit|nr:Rieske (2Fe-2S) protein [Methylomirabilota bacterium]